MKGRSFLLHFPLFTGKAYLPTHDHHPDNLNSQSSGCEIWKLGKGESNTGHTSHKLLKVFFICCYPHHHHKNCHHHQNEQDHHHRMRLSSMSSSKTSVRCQDQVYSVQKLQELIYPYIIVISKIIIIIIILNCCQLSINISMMAGFVCGFNLT